MWKKIKEFFLGKEEIEKVELRHIDTFGSTTVTDISSTSKVIENAKFICKDCKKTVARLKNICRGQVTEYQPLKDNMFQLVKNQYSKNKDIRIFSLSHSACHHCRSNNKLDYEVIWDE